VIKKRSCYTFITSVSETCHSRSKVTETHKVIDLTTERLAPLDKQATTALIGAADVCAGSEQT
jgi:hypothetical protein